MILGIRVEGLGNEKSGKRERGPDLQKETKGTKGTKWLEIKAEIGKFVLLLTFCLRFLCYLLLKNRFAPFVFFRGQPYRN